MQWHIQCLAYKLLSPGSLHRLQGVSKHCRTGPGPRIPVRAQNLVDLLKKERLLNLAGEHRAERGPSATVRALLRRLIPISAEELHTFRRRRVERIHPQVISLMLLLVGLLVEIIPPIMLLRVVILAALLGTFLLGELPL
jgi:hypothetical protein